jgi:hypothetical protein
MGRRLHSIACGFVLMLAGSASAQIGPPQPRATACCSSLGVGLHNVNSTWMPYEYDVARTRIYIEGSYAFSDSLEGFGRVGGSEWVINDVETYEPGKQHDVSSEGYPAFFSGGIRGMLWECEGLSIGASLEAAWYAGLEKYIRWDYDVYQRLFIDSTVEFNAGLSLGCDLGTGIVYVGPLIHFGYASADVRTHEFGDDWDVEDDIDELNVRDKGGWGAFLGWLMPLSEDGWKLQVELSVLQGGFGGAIGFFKAS